MKTILVVANETLGGRELLERIREHAAEEEIRVAICVPRTRPRHGNIIYDEAVFQAAQVRVDLARGFLRELGIDAVGEVGDPDPYTAIMNAVQFFHISEIVISTLPEGTSKWVADKLVERVKKVTNRPVEHVESSAEPVEV